MNDKTLEEEETTLTLDFTISCSSLTVEKQHCSIDEQVKQWTEKKQLEQQSKEANARTADRLKVALAEKQEHVRNESNNCARLEEWERRRSDTTR
ncbi:MAG: hypothetical protein KatS3mg080_0181 [Anoxybacillus sp.]|nr:MAG: hypothetical protein KatS3mg080_0181 [Anoxybacillus sp.]